MFRTIQQATEQALGLRPRKRHAKAQVPTNWTQSFTPSPPFGCWEGRKEAFPPTVKFPFPETAAEGKVKT